MKKPIYLVFWVTSSLQGQLGAHTGQINFPGFCSNPQLATIFSQPLGLQTCSGYSQDNSWKHPVRTICSSWPPPCMPWITSGNGRWWEYRSPSDQSYSKPVQIHGLVKDNKPNFCGNYWTFHIRTKCSYCPRVLPCDRRKATWGSALVFTKPK